jgi:hypothetical protein
MAADILGYSLAQLLHRSCLQSKEVDPVAFDLCLYLRKEAAFTSIDTSCLEVHTCPVSKAEGTFLVFLHHHSKDPIAWAGNHQGNQEGNLHINLL